MIYVYAATIAVVAGAGIYMILAQNIIRIILGIALLAAAANLLIFLSGRLGAVSPPIIQQGSEVLASYAANPLPQALVLTAIVIGFALTAFAIALAVKAYKSLGTLDTSQMRDAETTGSPFAAKPAQE